MNDQIWYYIIFAIIYFLFRRKKKKPNQTPNTAKTDAPQKRPQPVSFEELLKEITDQREPEQVVVEEPKPAPVPEPVKQEEKEVRTRKFADDESRRIYEESIQRAQEVDIEYKPNEHYATGKLVRSVEVESEPTIADEIREALKSRNSARKAIIYGEILNRRY